MGRDRRRRDAEEFALGRIRIGDKAALDDLGGTGDFGQRGGDEPAGAGFGGDDPPAAAAAGGERRFREAQDLSREQAFAPPAFADASP
jgi:hypothetical protein